MRVTPNLFLFAFCAFYSSIAGVAQFQVYDLGAGTSPTDVNNLGVIVGTRGSPANAIVYRDGVTTTLGIAGSSFATSINDFGVIVGYSGYTVPGLSAFSYLNGVRTPLGSLGGDSKAQSINSQGAITGSSGTSGPYAKSHAFLYNGGVMRDIGTFSSDHSYAYDINDSEQVVGYTLGSYRRAFLYQAGGVQYLGTLGGSQSVALAINNAGQVVGWAESATAHRAFLYQNGVMTGLNFGSDGEATDINDNGDVVGFGNVAGTTHGFLYRDGETFDLSSVLATIGLTRNTTATGINNNGWIIGTGATFAGETHGFLIIVPEPAAGIIFITGVFVRIGSRFRK